MGVFDWISSFGDALTPNDLEAEAPQGGASTKTPVSGSDEESPEESEVNKQDAKDGDDAEPEEQSTGGDDEEEEEEEEEEEAEDPKPKIEEDCMHTKECSPAKHHFDECSERVTGKIESDGKADEDCVEEFFHLVHCASACAAPKLFRELK